MSPQAVVLAGGLGTRLHAASAGLPKAMVPVNGRPFLRWLLELLRDRGIEEALLLTGYGADVIQDDLEREPVDGLRVRLSTESSPLGTGGALRKAAGLLQPRFVLLNGDTFLDIDYRGLLERASSDVGPVVLAVCAAGHDETDDPGNITIDADRWVTAYRRGSKEEALPYIDAGVSAWNRDVLDDLWPDDDAPFSLEQVLFPRLIGRRWLRAWHSPARFYDIGTPARLRLFETSLRGWVHLRRSPIVDAST